jgi:hypothetical protein
MVEIAGKKFAEETNHTEGELSGHAEGSVL